MRGKLFISASVLAALTTPSWAGERITLLNGFEMHCDHHAELEGRVRLYLSTGEDNYIEVSPSEVEAVEQVADLIPDPLPVIAPTTQPASPEQTIDANLSPADLREILAKAGVDHNLDVDLLASLVKAESGGNVRAVSPAGARGLMQLMPGTAAELGVQDSFKPDQNVRGGSAYLDALLNRYNNKLALALAAYNAGPAAVDKYHGIPPYHETRAYVARVIHEFNRRVLAREAQAKQTVASAASHDGKGSR
jgi:transglycosylase-like protein with SLT domain